MDLRFSAKQPADRYPILHRGGTLHTKRRDELPHRIRQGTDTSGNGVFVNLQDKGYDRGGRLGGIPNRLLVVSEGRTVL